MATGDDHAIFMQADRSVLVLGSNTHAQLGTPATSHLTHSAAPLPVPSLRGVKCRSISAGFTRSAAVLLDGAVIAWGAAPWIDAESTAHLGGNATFQQRHVLLDEATATAGGEPTRAVSVAVGPAHLGIVDEHGHLWHQGEFPGHPGAQLHQSPVSVEGPMWGLGTSHVVAGWDCTLAAMSDRRVWCWGRVPYTPPSHEESPVSGAGLPASSAVAGTAAAKLTPLASPASITTPHLAADLQESHTLHTKGSGVIVPDLHGAEWLAPAAAAPIAPHAMWRRLVLHARVPGQRYVGEEVPASPSNGPMPTPPDGDNSDADSVEGGAGDGGSGDWASTSAPGGDAAQGEQLFRETAFPAADGATSAGVLPLSNEAPLGPALGISSDLRLQAVAGHVKWLPVAVEAPNDTVGSDSDKPLDPLAPPMQPPRENSSEAAEARHRPLRNAHREHALHEWLHSSWVSQMAQADAFCVAVVHADPLLTQGHCISEQAAEYAGTWSLARVLQTTSGTDTPSPRDALQLSQRVWADAWVHMQGILRGMSNLRLPGWAHNSPLRGPIVRRTSVDSTELSAAWVREDGLAAVQLRQLLRRWTGRPAAAVAPRLAIEEAATAAPAAASNAFATLADDSDSSDSSDSEDGAQTSEKGTAGALPSEATDSTLDAPAVASLAALLAHVSRGAISGEEQLGGLPVTLAVQLASLPAEEMWLRLEDEAVRRAIAAAGAGTVLRRNPPASKAFPGGEAMNVATLHHIQNSMSEQWMDELCGDDAGHFRLLQAGGAFPTFPCLGLVWGGSDATHTPQGLLSCVEGGSMLMLPLALAASLSSPIMKATVLSLLQLHGLPLPVELQATGTAGQAALGAVVVQTAGQGLQLWQPPAGAAPGGRPTTGMLPPQGGVLVFDAGQLMSAGAQEVQAPDGAWEAALEWCSQRMPMAGVFKGGSIGIAAKTASEAPISDQAVAGLGTMLVHQLHLGGALHAGVGGSPLAALHGLAALVDASVLMQRSQALRWLRLRQEVGTLRGVDFDVEGDASSSEEEDSVAQADHDDDASGGDGVKVSVKSARTGRRKVRVKGRTRADSPGRAEEWGRAAAAKEEQERTFGADAPSTKGKWQNQVVEGGGFVTERTEIYAEADTGEEAALLGAGGVISLVRKMAHQGRPDAAASGSDSDTSTALWRKGAGGVEEDAPPLFSAKHQRRLKARLEAARYDAFREWQGKQKASAVHVAARGADGIQAARGSAGWGSLEEQAANALRGDARAYAAEQATQNAFLALSAAGLGCIEGGVPTSGGGLGALPAVVSVDSSGGAAALLASGTGAVRRSDTDHDFMHVHRDVADMLGGAFQPHGGGVSSQLVKQHPYLKNGLQEQVLEPLVFRPRPLGGIASGAGEEHAPCTDVDILTAFGPSFGVLWWEPDPQMAPPAAAPPSSLIAPLAPPPSPFVLSLSLDDGTADPPQAFARGVPTEKAAITAVARIVPAQLSEGMGPLCGWVYNSAGLAASSLEEEVEAEHEAAPAEEAAAVQNSAKKRGKRQRQQARSERMEFASTASVPRSLVMASALAALTGDVLLVLPPQQGAASWRMGPSVRVPPFSLANAFRVHSWVLAARAPAAAEALAVTAALPQYTDGTGAACLILPPYMTPSSVPALLQYLYAGRLTVQADTAIPLLRVAALWRMRDLADLAEHYIICSDLSEAAVSTLSQLLLLADATQSRRLQRFVCAEGTARGRLAAVVNGTVVDSRGLVASEASGVPIATATAVESAAAAGRSVQTKSSRAAAAAKAAALAAAAARAQATAAAAVADGQSDSPSTTGEEPSAEPTSSKGGLRGLGSPGPRGAWARGNLLPTALPSRPTRAASEDADPGIEDDPGMPMGGDGDGFGDCITAGSLRGRLMETQAATAAAQSGSADQLLPPPVSFNLRGGAGSTRGARNARTPVGWSSASSSEAAAAPAPTPAATARAPPAGWSRRPSPSSSE